MMVDKPGAKVAREPAGAQPPADLDSVDGTTKSELLVWTSRRGGCQNHDRREIDVR